MAGIGFRLHKLVEGDTYMRAATAYLSSAVISAGPWLSSVVSLLLLGGASAAFLNQTDGALLIVTITYAFGSSLVLTGGPQMMVTRFLADRFYLEDEAAVAPTLNGVLLMLIPLSVITVPFLILAPFDWRYRLLTATLFIALSLNWLVGVFLSAARYYANIVVIYLIGHGMSLGGAIWLGHSYGLIGSLAGYTIGQVTCMLLLVAHIFQEFAHADTINLAFVMYAKRYWDLLVLGLLSMMGIWADNVIYWVGPGSRMIAGFYRSNPAYDSMKLLGYLTTIPASAMFLVHIETKFFRHYRAFYRHIEDGGTLAEIMRAKRGMIEAAKSGLINVCKLQGIVVTAALLFAPDLIRLLGLPAARVPLFRVLVVAANCQFIMLLAVILLLYLDERRLVLMVTALFVISNIGFTLTIVWSGRHLEGGGYLIASIIAGLAALALLKERLRLLEYRTFMLQPIRG